jgi:UDP-GlcNAc:undecaprenyl-phosphate GlcNAc-1-phosphate transferase
MTEFIPVIFVSGVISFIATPLVRRLAQSANFVDNPSTRKVHAVPMPMLGGVAIYIALVGAVIVSGVQSYTEVLAILGGATVMTLFGLWDDRVGISPAVKIVGQLIAGVLLILGGIQVKLFAIQALNIALTLFWIVGICNAINFQDNMDGLAAGLATAASAFFLGLAMLEGLQTVSILAAALLGASIGFLYYNFNPASLFMGDAGSLLIGFVLAVLGIKLTFTGRPLAATWMIPIIILGVPIFDTTLVVFSRLRRGKHIYQGGKDHTSHRLVASLGMTPARSVMTLYVVAGVLGLMAIMLRDATPEQARLLLAVLVIVFIGALAFLEVRFPNEPGAGPEPPSSG